MVKHNGYTQWLKLGGKWADREINNKLVRG